MLAGFAVALLVTGLIAYAVLAGADFGAGFWDLTAGSAERGARVRGLIERSIGPVWESNHVWLIFVLVVCWTAFPTAFGSLMSTLAVALLIALVGIMLRGAGFAFRGSSTTVAQQRFFGAFFAVSSLIVPFFLGAAIGGIASGRVPAGNAQGDPLTSWANPTSALIGVLAIVTGAYLAAVYMAGDAHRGGHDDLVERMRLRALGAGVAAGLVALGGLFVVREDARPLFDGLTEGAALVAVIISIVAGAGGLWLIWTRRFGPARLVAAAAVAAIACGWALAQEPEFLPGALTVDEAAAGDATLTALLIGFVVGVLVLAPSLLLLWRLVLRGRLDRDFRPLGPERRQ